MQGEPGLDACPVDYQSLLFPMLTEPDLCVGEVGPIIKLTSCFTKKFVQIAITISAISLKCFTNRLQAALPPHMLGSLQCSADPLIEAADH